MSFPGFASVNIEAAVDLDHGAMVIRWMPTGSLDLARRGGPSLLWRDGSRSSGASRDVAGPVVHQHDAALVEVRAKIGRLGRALGDRMRQRRLGNLARKVGFLGCPARGRPSACHERSRHCRRAGHREAGSEKTFSLSGRPGRRPGNTRSPGRPGSPSSARAAAGSGTTCALRLFMRAGRHQPPGGLEVDLRPRHAADLGASRGGQDQEPQRAARRVKVRLVEALHHARQLLPVERGPVLLPVVVHVGPHRRDRVGSLPVVPLDRPVEDPRHGLPVPPRHGRHGRPHRVEDARHVAARDGRDRPSCR